jgi:hypothetical protein
MAEKVTQGDSFGKDYYAPQVPAFIAGWTGKWNLCHAPTDAEIEEGKLVGTELANGVMEISADQSAFELRVPPTVIELLALGDYIVTAQVENAVLLFRKEVGHEKITVIPQGLPD